MRKSSEKRKTKDEEREERAGAIEPFRLHGYFMATPTNSVGAEFGL